MFASDAFFYMLIVITCPFTVTHVFEVYFLSMLAMPSNLCLSYPFW